MTRTLKTQIRDIADSPDMKTKRAKHRPMPADPRDLARAMFRQADQRMFAGQIKKKSEV